MVVFYSGCCGGRAPLFRLDHRSCRANSDSSSGCRGGFPSRRERREGPLPRLSFSTTFPNLAMHRIFAYSIGEIYSPELTVALGRPHVGQRMPGRRAIRRPVQAHDSQRLDGEAAIMALTRPYYHLRTPRS